jgi:hypothetical protein
MQILGTMWALIIGAFVTAALVAVVFIFSTGMLRVREAMSPPNTLCLEFQSQSYCAQVSEWVIEALHSFGERHTE